VEKVIFHSARFVAEAKNKLVVSEVCEVLHDVPQNWAVTDMHHGFRNCFGVIPKSRALTTTKQNYFQPIPSDAQGEATSIWLFSQRKMCLQAQASVFARDPW
jgi:hypothetical protein